MVLTQRGSSCFPGEKAKKKKVKKKNLRVFLTVSCDKEERHLCRSVEDDDDEHGERKELWEDGI